MSESTASATEETSEEILGKSDEASVAKMHPSKKKMTSAPEEGAEEAKADTAEDYLKSAPPVVVEMIKSLEAKAKTAEEALQKSLDDVADAKAIEKAKGWANLSLNANEFGPAFRRLSSFDAELAKSIENVLDSLNTQAEKSQIFAEFGKSTSATGDNALDTIEAMAKSLVDTNVAKNFADAMAQVANANPELYTQYRNEKKG